MPRCPRRWRCAIEKAFDVSMDMLLRMQAWHDASQMRARANEVSVQRYVPA